MTGGLDDDLGEAGLIHWTAGDPGAPYHVVTAIGRNRESGDRVEAVESLAVSLPIAAWIELNDDDFAVVLIGGHGEGILRCRPTELRVPPDWLVVATATVGSRDELNTASARVMALREFLLAPAYQHCDWLSQAEFAAINAAASIPLAERARFARKVLGRVLGPPSERAERLLEVLRGTAQGLSAGDLAKQLHVHAKTVAYRKNVIRAISGINLNRTEHRHLALVALHLWQLEESRMPPVGSKVWLYPVV